MSKSKKVWAVGLFLLTITSVFAVEPPTFLWGKKYNAGYNDVAHGIVMDSDNTFWIAGYSANASDNDVRLIKYDTDGNVLWSGSFDRGSHEEAYAVALDKDGSVYVTGYASSAANSDCLIMKYKNQGDTVWTRIAAAGLPSDVPDRGRGIAVGQNYVYVTGYYTDLPDSGTIRTLAYSKDGGFIKVKNFDTPGNDQAGDIVLDGEGSVYVAGFSGHDFRVIKYSSELDEIWSKTYDAGDIDRGMGIAVDDSGFVYVTGFTWAGSEFTDLLEADFCTISLNKDGTLRWSRIYDSGRGDMGTDVALDSRYVYVTGGLLDTLVDTIISGYRTVCYDRSGNLLWSVLYPDTQALTWSYSIALDDHDNLFIAGILGGLTPEEDMLTLKYGLNNTVEEKPIPPSPVYLDVIDARGSCVTLSCILPPDTRGTLSFYSVSGGLIETHPLPPSQSSFVYDGSGFSSGVYFAVLKTGGYSKTAKFVLVR